MYFTIKRKICGGNDEMDTAGFDQYKYSRSSAKSRRTVICRISVHQKSENHSDIEQNTIDNSHELTNFRNSNKNETPNTVTYL